MAESSDAFSWEEQDANIVCRSAIDSRDVLTDSEGFYKSSEREEA